jgi:hypothetical protein
LALDSLDLFILFFVSFNEFNDGFLSVIGATNCIYLIIYYYCSCNYSFSSRNLSVSSKGFKLFGQAEVLATLESCCNLSFINYFNKLLASFLYATWKSFISSSLSFPDGVTQPLLLGLFISNLCNLLRLIYDLELLRPERAPFYLEL